MSTPVASEGPAFSTRMVKVVSVPCSTVPGAANLLIERSMTGFGVALAESWSSSEGVSLSGVESGSGWSLAVTWALFT